MAWGTTAGTAVVAYRLACQLAENAKAPAMHGVLPEANHNQVVALDGAWTRAEPDDFFRDRLDEPTAIRLRLVLLREAGEHPQITRRADASRALAQERGVPVTELTAVGESSYERLASLVGLVDYASVYLAILSGIDPSPIAPITELKQRISE
jgi:glucose/mannose-6-phosphate isomerase